MQSIFALLIILGFPPCPYEDSTTTCYWNAAERGNGEGHSFVVWEGEVFYIN